MGNFTTVEESIAAIVSDLPQSVIKLTISVTPVKELPEMSFAHLQKLEDLRMDHNQLRTIDVLAFRNLDQLKSLNLSFNYISELNRLVFKDLHELTFLSLTNNMLKQLPVDIFTNVLNLNTLILRQNILANFSWVAQSVSHLKNLTKLDLCFNNLTSLHHSNTSLPKSLTVLYLSRNNLSTLSCDRSFLKRIKWLDLSYNPKLPSMAFQGVDLRRINYLRLRSTSVRLPELLNVSNVNAAHVDFSGMGLKSDKLVKGLCSLLRVKVQKVKHLRLGSNEIVDLENLTLSNCPQITGDLDLSRNHLKSIKCLSFLKGQNLTQTFTAEHNHLTSLRSCKNTLHFPHLKEFSVRYNRILSVSSFAFYHTPNIVMLQLNINNIAYLDRKAFKGLKLLETLRLDNNLLTDLFNNSFEDLKSLQILNLRNNRISVIFNGTFLSLNNLTTLDLGGNKITHFESAGLHGLKSLSNLYLDGNRLKQIVSALYGVFQNTLEVLDLQGNQICFLKEITSSPFVNLSKLRDLKLDSQKPYGITLLPNAFFRGLHSLESLYLTNNHITYLAPDAFDDLKGLRFLTLDSSFVGVAQLQPGVFKNLRNLTRLSVENMGIQNFSKDVFGNLTRLQTLQLNRNVMQSLDVEALDALPMLRYLDIRNIPLSCTCQNSILQNWTVNNQNVQLVYLYNLPCQGDKEFKFYNFLTNVCYIDLGEYLFVITAVVIFLFSVIPLLYVKLYWKMKYSYYVFRSWFGKQWRRLMEEEENCKYDAFVSYNSHDEHWVLNQLLPNLEGNGSSFKLCLHHRDFELGRDIVDNIVSAVYGSRKTICVVSKNFLRSEWCSMEIQLASYRLFDEHRDVLLLVLLEPIADRQLSSYHRMRKVMLKKTYLQWPGSDCSDPVQAQGLFWKKLRSALRSGSRLEEEEEDEEMERNEGCLVADGEKTKHSVNQTSDENYYLLP
ncbi:toll-like receptor 21 [Polymixia lowei]